VASPQEVDGSCLRVTRIVLYVPNVGVNISTAKKVTGVQILTIVHSRRAGEPPVLVASPEMAKSELGWQLEYPELEAVIESVWRWQKRHPQGYGESASR